MLKAVIYCRVSTKEQVHNLSLATQESQCRTYCGQQGFPVDRVFVEQGESAKTTNRPEFQKLLLYCREHRKQIGFVVVHSLSRFSRHVTDHHQIRALLMSFGIRLRSVTELIDETAAGKLMESMFAAVAEYDNQTKAERTVIGMRAAAEQGRWPFPPPVGYRVVSTSSQSHMEPDPERAPLIQMAFELFASGDHERIQVLRKVTASGLRTRNGKTVSPQTFSKILTNPIYVGRISVPKWGMNHAGSFAPIVSEETFQRVQSVLAGRGIIVGPYSKEHPDFPLRHFVRCSRCDRPLTASWSKGRSKKYAYYRCAGRECKFVNCAKLTMEESFIELLTRLQPKREYLRLFKAVVLDVWKTQQAEAIKLTEALRKKIELIKQSKNRLVDAFLHQGKIDQDTYQDQLDRLREEHALAEMELNEARIEELDIEAIVNFATSVLSDTSRFWIAAPLDQKRRFQKVLFPEGITFDGEEFGTAPTCLAFSYLREVSQPKVSLASRTGVEPVSPP